MTDSFKDNKRVVFPKGKQEAFLRKALTLVSVQELAKLCVCSERAVRDWRREKFTMPYGAVEKICKKTDQSFPTQVQLIDAFAHTSEAGKKGGKAIIQKYGKIPVDEEFRKEQWEKWWKEKGHRVTHLPNIPKSIETPKKSEELAEFIGIMMGDGGISDYQCTVSLHSIDDREYAEFVIGKIESLFGISPSVYTPTQVKVRIIVISRVELVKYLHSLGLPIGDKIRQYLDIPLWIKENKNFSKFCVRGLIDTDGSVFTHAYISKGKKYSYKKLSFTSASPALVKSVSHVLAENGMSPRISGRDVRLDSIKDMELYFRVIGSSNPKHLNRLAS